MISFRFLEATIFIRYGATKAAATPRKSFRIDHDWWLTRLVLTRILTHADRWLMDVNGAKYPGVGCIYSVKSSLKLNMFFFNDHGFWWELLRQRMSSNPFTIFYFNHNHNQYPSYDPTIQLSIANSHQANSQICTNTWVLNLPTTGEVLCKVPALLNPPRFGARSDQLRHFYGLRLPSFWVEKHKDNAWTCLKQLNWRRCASENKKKNAGSVTCWDWEMYHIYVMILQWYIPHCVL